LFGFFFIQTQRLKIHSQLSGGLGIHSNYSFIYLYMSLISRDVYRLVTDYITKEFVHVESPFRLKVKSYCALCYCALLCGASNPPFRANKESVHVKNKSMWEHKVESLSRILQKVTAWPRKRKCCGNTTFQSEAVTPNSECTCVLEL
jgi:hypothetical protein